MQKSLTKSLIPAYSPKTGPNIFLASETFHRHMTDEGWQLQIGLADAGYQLWGRYLENDETDVPSIVRRTDPAVIIVQDKREWDPSRWGCFDKTISFYNSGCLAGMDDVFRLTIVKDAHRDADYHRQAHEEIGVHAWIVYYEPSKICKLAPWIRPEHVIRTYHSVDKAVIPAYSAERGDAVISGCLFPTVYPLRAWIADLRLPNVTVINHPGYHANGAMTPGFLQTLNRFKVSFCTTSIFGYALRKIVESVACGCVPITNLPESDLLPVIDEALVRIPDKLTRQELSDVIVRECADYDPDYRRYLAELAVEVYDYRVQGQKLAHAIDTLRWSFITDG